MAFYNQFIDLDFFCCSSKGMHRPICYIKFSASSSDQLEYMVVRAQMDQVKLQEFNFEHVESMTNTSTTYTLISSPTEQLSPCVTQCVFHAFSTSELAQLHPDSHYTPILRCYSNVTSWNIRLLNANGEEQPLKSSHYAHQRVTTTWNGL